MMDPRNLWALVALILVGAFVLATLSVLAFRSTKYPAIIFLTGAFCVAIIGGIIAWNFSVIWMWTLTVLSVAITMSLVLVSNRYPGKDL